jgi:hypothetical protein
MTFDSEIGRPFRFLSLGSDCQVAHHISHIKPNTIPHFFDWLATPIQSLIRLIENDFEGFAEPENLHPFFLGNRIMTVVETRYRVDLTHDFGDFTPASVERVRQGYRLKIRWLREMLDDPDEMPTYFIRRWDTRDGPENEADARRLFGLLRQRRRDIRFLYLHRDRTRGAVKENGYRSRYLPDLNEDWRGDHEAWRDVLSRFAVEAGPDDGAAFALPVRRKPRFSLETLASQMS